ncbi:MAG TPA: hypothetical protein VFJ72_03580, partial [Rubrobacteraceae bacterium]|nr:hypothetical protein [Rubrobacteraceae bacterium]
PSRNDEYLLYQTLLGAWPLGEMSEDALADFTGRIKAYMEKAIREAQVHTSWTKVNEEYEEAVAGFVEAVLSPDNNLFLDDFLTFQRRIARAGALNALSQTLLKLTVPGVPDVYQGNDLWDLSLVDPDNRRPVDYGLRGRLLGDLKAMDPAESNSLLDGDTWKDGRPKLYLTWKALELRRRMPELFESGEYVPLETTGALDDHLVAFARLYEKEAAIMVVPRLYAKLNIGEALMFGEEVWTGTRISLPEELAETPLHNLLTGEKVRIERGEEGAFVHAGGILGGFPVALLAAEG